jgi:hypothetical protein
MLGPTTFDTTNVRGRLHVAGRPLTPGWVEFWPIDGTVGNLRSAPLGADGSFSATRVPVGRVLVRFVPAGRFTTQDSRLDALVVRCQGFDSPVRITIADHPDWLDIDVAAPRDRMGDVPGSEVDDDRQMAPS